MKKRPILGILVLALALLLIGNITAMAGKKPAPVTDAAAKQDTKATTNSKVQAKGQTSEACCPLNSSTGSSTANSACCPEARPADPACCPSGQPQPPGCCPEAKSPSCCPETKKASKKDDSSI